MNSWMRLNNVIKHKPSSAFSSITGALSTRISSGLGPEMSGVAAAGSNRSYKTIRYRLRNRYV